MKGPPGFVSRSRTNLRQSTSVHRHGHASSSARSATGLTRSTGPEHKTTSTLSSAISLWAACAARAGSERLSRVTNRSGWKRPSRHHTPSGRASATSPIHQSSALPDRARCPLRADTTPTLRALPLGGPVATVVDVDAVTVVVLALLVVVAPPGMVAVVLLVCWPSSQPAARLPKPAPRPAAVHSAAAAMRRNSRRLMAPAATVSPPAR